MGINRDIKLCVLRLQIVWAYALEQYKQMYPEAPKLILVETFRSAAVQTAYFAQGRKSLAEVNALRKTAGLEPIGPKENKSKITFKPAGGSMHEKMVNGDPASKAFDVGFIKTVDGKSVMDWSTTNYQRIERIIRQKFPEVTWGGDWDRDGRSDDETFVDLPHFQVA
jgi:peptidoglycan L-alanyl-D-glutamate endopeptidase CwlK